MTWTAIYCEPGDVVDLELPHSEVCIHMQVAGRKMKAIVQPRSVQILNPDGTMFSAPILHGEAGLYTDFTGPKPRLYYVHKEV